MAQLLEVDMEGLYYGQQIINRWNYNGSGTPSGVSMSFALASAFGAIPVGGVYPAGTVIAGIKELMPPQFQFVQIIAKMIYVPTDFYTAPFLTGTVGVRAGDNTEQSPTQAYGFFTNLVRRDVSRATKRLPGFMGSDVQTTDGKLKGQALTAMNVIATAMSATLNYTDGGNNLTFQPCVAGKEKYTTPSGGTAYRYFSTEAAQQAKLALGIVWSPYDTPRTQTSRQYKRGS